MARCLVRDFLPIMALRIGSLQLHLTKRVIRGLSQLLQYGAVVKSATVHGAKQRNIHNRQYQTGRPPEAYQFRHFTCKVVAVHK